MNADKLNGIIRRKNERLEEDALRNASDIIDEIGAQQGLIAAANTKIAKLRDELKALEVQSVDPAAILGE